MEEARFWAIIETGGRKALADPDRQLAVVRKQLLKLSSEDIRDFHRMFTQHWRRLTRGICGGLHI